MITSLCLSLCDKIYFVGTDNTAFINLSDNNKTVLYTAPADKTVSFAGISLKERFVKQRQCGKLR